MRPRTIHKDGDNGNNGNENKDNGKDSAFLHCFQHLQIEVPYKCIENPLRSIQHQLKILLKIC